MLKTNHYFDDKVISISLQTETLPATVGVMDIGEYQFDTSQYERVTVVSGELNVKLPDSNEWQRFPAGDSFEIPANKTFDVKTDIQTAYFCTYE